MRRLAVAKKVWVHIIYRARHEFCTMAAVGLKAVYGAI